MDGNDIKDLLDLGYSMSQVSQFMNIERKGVVVTDIFNLENSDYLASKDLDYFRYFNKILSDAKYNKEQKAFLFKCFVSGIDLTKTYNSKLGVRKKIVVLDTLYKAKEKLLEIDVEPMLKDEFTEEVIKMIGEDLLAEIDVRKYLDKKLTSAGQKFVRSGLLQGIDMLDDVKEFKFLTEKNDFDNLKFLITNKYDYKEVLRKIKDTNKTIFICDKRKEGIDLLKYVNNKMSYDVICDLHERIKAKENVSMLKSMPIYNVEEIPLLMKVHELGYPLQKCKTYGQKKLNNLILCLEYNIPHEEIEKIINTVFVSLIPPLAECYRQNDTDMIEFIRKNEGNLAFDYAKPLEELLKYNGTLEDKFDIKKILTYDDKLVSLEVFTFFAKYIINGTIDQKLLKTFKSDNYTSTQCKIIMSAYEAKYDLTPFLDSRLSSEDMRAIKRCMDLGLSIEKTKAYEFKEKNNEDEIHYKSNRFSYSKNGFSYEIFLDDEGGGYYTYYK